MKTCATCQREYKGEGDFLSETSRWRKCDLGNLWFNCSCGSTLMLSKGKFEWYSPDKFMSSKAASIFNHLSGIEALPHIPATVMELQQMVQDPNKKPEDFAKVMKRDPFIAAEVLSMGNQLKSSRNPDDKPIDSLEHAIVYMGQKTLSDLVFAASIKSMKLATSKFDETRFWNESFLTAAIAETLTARYATYHVRDEMFLAGCLANVGKIVAAIVVPDKLDQIYDEVHGRKTMTHWTAAEAIFEGVDHCILGEIGAAIWGLPEYVLDAIKDHHRKPADTRSEFISPQDIAAFANQLCHWINLEPYRIDEELLHAHASRFGLSERDIEKLANELSYLRETAERLAS